MAALAVENGEAERTTAHQERDAEEAAEARGRRGPGAGDAR